MKAKFSKAWIGSKQTRKQRKYRYNAPLHISGKMISANLSKELKKKHSIRSLPVRKGDEVTIMRGEFRKKTGKISIVDLKKKRVSIEGMQRSKRDGTKVNLFFDASNLQIRELNLDDKKRFKKKEIKQEKTNENKEEQQNVPKKK